ncbi:MAG TPA: hypothetical protein VHB74_08395, partial [Devosia sp.]|nr:hypothetical protein [Devosia sp.]
MVSQPSRKTARCQVRFYGTNLAQTASVRCAIQEAALAKKGSGLTITQRSNGSWRAQIRKTGFPYESREFLSHEDADAWGLRRLSEIQTTGRLVDRRPAERTTLAMAIEAYIDKVTSKRPGEISRVSEEARLRRFLRDESHLCAHALAHVTSEMVEQWRDRRLTERAQRGKLSDRGRNAAAVVPPGRLRKDGTPRKNAARPRPPKAQSVISPSTVRREMTLLKRVFDFARKEYKLAANPLSAGLVDRPAAQDERDVRLSVADWQSLLRECQASRNPYFAAFVEMAFEVGTRRGSLLKLAWSDVHPDQAKLVLRGVKNSREPNKVRTVEVGLSPRAIELLRMLPRTADVRVFPITKEAVASAFRRAREKAGC